MSSGLGYPSVHLGIKHDAFLSGRLIARADAHRGFLFPVDCNMQNVCRDVDVVPGPNDLAVLQLVVGPDLKFAVEQVEGGLMPLVQMGSIAGRPRRCPAVVVRSHTATRQSAYRVFPRYHAKLWQLGYNLSRTGGVGCS